MSRNVVLLSDGTGNSAGKLFKTNVWRTYQLLDLSNPIQVALYDDGVGTSSFKPLALLGGAIGWGLKRNLISLYMFLCRNYDPGDRIFCFGFSRGAFTIRVLTKFILTQGLVTEYGSVDELRRKSLTLYREFRRKEPASSRVSGLIRRMVYFAIKPFESKKIETRPIASIEFVGVWDTVDAYGLPTDELKTGIDYYIWPLALFDRRLDHRIQKACQALAIDDTRKTFHPLLWDETEPPHSIIKTHTDKEQLTQVWFAGAHANIGGGYPDDGLSYVPLRWMILEAQKKGLRLSSNALGELSVRAAPFGRLYDSRAGFGAYYRYAPRRLDPPIDKQGARIPNPKVHESVLWRMALGTDTYAPLSLPAALRIVTERSSERPDTNILEFLAYQKAIQTDPRLRGDAGTTQSTDPAENKSFNIAALRQPNAHAMELMWATVWWRQVAFFGTVLATLSLVFSPALSKLAFGLDFRNLDRVVEASYSLSALKKVIVILANLLQPVIQHAIDIAFSYFPAFAAPWLEAYRASAWGVALSTLVLVGLLSWGRLIDRRTHDRALAAWNTRWEYSRFKWMQSRTTLRIVTATIVAILATAATLRFLWIYSSGALLQFPCSESAWDDCAGDVEVLLHQGIDFRVVPLLFVSGAFALLGGLAASAVGYVAFAYRLSQQLRQRKEELPGLALWIAIRARRSRALEWLRLWVTRSLVPVAFAALLVVTVVIGFNRASFAILDGLDAVCRWTKDGELSLQPGQTKEAIFDPSAACNETTIVLDSGVNYEIEVANTVVTFTDPDRNGSKVITQDYLELPKVSWLKRLALPLRRDISRPWYVPVIRLSSPAREEFAISKRGSLVRPREAGKLYIFINDAVLGLPFGWDLLYRRSDKPWKVRVTNVDNASDSVEEKGY